MKERNTSYESKMGKIIYKTGQVLDKLLFINYQVVYKSPWEESMEQTFIFWCNRKTQKGQIAIGLSQKNLQTMQKCNSIPTCTHFYGKWIKCKWPKTNKLPASSEKLSGSLVAV